MHTHTLLNTTKLCSNGNVLLKEGDKRILTLSSMWGNIGHLWEITMCIKFNRNSLNSRKGKIHVHFQFLYHISQYAILIHTLTPTLIGLIVNIMCMVCNRLSWHHPHVHICYCFLVDNSNLNNDCVGAEQYPTGQGETEEFSKGMILHNDRLGTISPTWGIIYCYSTATKCHFAKKKVKLISPFSCRRLGLVALSPTLKNSNIRMEFRKHSMGILHPLTFAP